jgi:hypothetical protein
LFAQGAGDYFTETDTNFSSIIPITMMGYSAANNALVNGSENIMVFNDTQNIAQPPKNNQS